MDSEVSEERVARLRRVMPDESPIDLDEHARRIAEIVPARPSKGGGGMSERCSECGRIHCEKCSETQEVIAPFVGPHLGYRQSEDGVSHDVVRCDNGWYRIVCTASPLRDEKNIPMKGGVEIIGKAARPYSPDCTYSVGDKGE